MGFMRRVDSSPEERQEGEEPLGKAGGLGSWGMECEVGWVRGSEFVSNVLVCARTCQVGTAMRHRAAGRDESVKCLVPKFWQKKEEKQKGEEEGIEVVAGQRSPEAHILITKGPTSLPTVQLSQNLKWAHSGGAGW